MSRKFSITVLDTLLKTVEVEFKIPLLGFGEIKFPVSEHAKEWWKNEKAREDLLNAIDNAEQTFSSQYPDNKAAQLLKEFSLKNEEEFQRVIAELLNHFDEQKITWLMADKLGKGFEKIVSNKELQNALIDYIPYLRDELSKIKEFREVITYLLQKQIASTTSLTYETTQEIKDLLLEQRTRKTENQLIFTPEVFNDIDKLPEPSDFLPPGSRMPFYRNKVFTGRESDLISLAKTLLGSNQGSSTTIITQAIATTGMGGIGKTQLAIEFCYRYGRYFHGVHWVNAYNASIEAEIASCGREMDIKHFPDTTLEQVTTTVREWQKQSMRLLVFDNLEDPKLVTKWLPKLNGLHILITTRRQQWSPDFGLSILPLGTLQRSESLTMFRKLAPRLIETSDEDVNLLAEKLGDLPLAIDLAGRYLHIHPTLTPISYIQSLDEILEHESMQSKWFEELGISSPTSHDLSLLGTFKLSWEKLQNQIQQQIFILSGWLAPNTPIPSELFKAAFGIDSKKVEEIIYQLDTLGLVHSTFGQPTIHPLLAAYARSLDKDIQNLIILRDGIEKEIFTHLSEFAAQEPKLVATKLAQLHAHVRACISHINNKQPENIHILWFLYGWIMSSIGNYYEAKESLEKDLEFAIKIHGTIEHPEVRPTALLLAGVLTKLARYSDAEHLLAVKTSPSSDDNSVEFLSALTLASLYHDTEDYAKAKALLEPLLSSKESELGKEHLLLTPLLTALGDIHRHLGDYVKARALLERALEISEKELTSDNPQIAVVVNDLGMVFETTGHTQKAIQMFQRALSVNEKYYGTEHPETATSASNLGYVCYNTGDLERAKILLERALKIRLKTFGEEHHAVAQCFHRLSLVFTKMNELTQALNYEHKALAIYQKQFSQNSGTVSILQRNIHNLERQINPSG